MMDLSYRPNVLFIASIERMGAARRLIGLKPPDYVLASYLSGLAVESILQALALRGGSAHDAKHSLPNWLGKCPFSLHEKVKGSAEWNEVVALWDNGLRYLSYDALLGYFRKKGYANGKKGGVESKVRSVTKHLVDAAETIHKKGLSVWVSSTKK
jgi:hypothetical protein